VLLTAGVVGDIVVVDNRGGRVVLVEIGTFVAVTFRSISVSTLLSLFAGDGGTDE
jgi:hypothetical protein